MKPFFDWLGPVASAALIGALVALIGHFLVWRQRSRELRDALKRHSEQLEHSLKLHREKIEADARAQNANLENAWNLHREKIEADVSKDNMSRKMQLRREVFTDGQTAIGKAAFWLAKISDKTTEPDFKSPVIQEFALAIGKLVIIGNERTVEATYEVLDRWRRMTQTAIDSRFGHENESLPDARRAFAESNLKLILALRAELDLTIDEEWFRKTALSAVDKQIAQSEAWVDQVKQRTGS